MRRMVLWSGSGGTAEHKDGERKTESCESLPEKASQWPESHEGC